MKVVLAVHSHAPGLKLVSLRADRRGSIRLGQLHEVHRKFRHYMLVDDDQALRRLVQRILTQQGFHIIEASDGAEALQVASAYAEPLDLLLTDVIMPKVNGLVLARRLLHERPGIGVLYMSGYVEKSILLAKHPESIVLQKPFTADALIAAVGQMLASKAQQ
jgi:two-component system cell cycle sensor histidine kinase/response regulator CckA